MTAPTIVEPACPGSPKASDRTDPSPHPDSIAGPRLHAERRSIADIPRETWDALASRNPWATPFSAWAFQRAWWDAYSANAHEETLVVVSGDASAGVDGR